MTTTHDERQRLAAMAAALRPDWPAASLYTHLTREHALRSYRDLAVALAWIACDPETRTPARLLEPGPWWTATQPVGPRRQQVAITGRCSSCGGWHVTAADCDPPEDRRVGHESVGAYLEARQALKGDRS